VSGDRGHPHAHAHGGGAVGSSGEPSAALRRRVLWWALAANGAFMVVEIVGGFVFDSLALLADALHMGTDVVGLGIALVAQALILRPASARHTYGLQRAEVLGALANGVLLVAAAGWIFYEAVERLGQPAEVDGTGVVVVATIGLAVNVGCAIFLRRAQGRSLNMRGAYLHMVLDAAGSVAAIAAGVAVVVADADWVDPLMSILVGLLVLWSTWGLLRDTVQVLLEGTPRGLSVPEVEGALAATPGVSEVHHVHLWDIASDTPALSAHVVLDGEPSLHDAQLRGDAMKMMLQDRFGIGHATLELECHECATPADGGVSADHA
jgi:cobalt-zinc-cadmium efflux system protein